MTRKLTLTCLIATATLAPAYGATPAAYAALDRRTSVACITSSGLRDASVGPVTRFSDRVGMDARTVTGTYPQAHMNGQVGTMLCLYNRATRRAETAEMQSATAPNGRAAIKDVWWRGVAINGETVGTSPVTMMLGSDGKIGGRSACNNYSVNYMLTGIALRIYPGIIGTRMACPPLRMAQETAFRTTLATVSMASLDADGSLILSGPSGQTLRFERDMARN